MAEIRQDLEEFVKIYEHLQEKITPGNKGYLRELLEDDEYACGLRHSVRILNMLIPRAKYYYEFVKDKHLGPEELEVLMTGTGNEWMNGLRIRDILPVS